MVQLAIRWHPRVPISSDELEGWLELDPTPLLAGDRLLQANSYTNGQAA